MQGVNELDQDVRVGWGCYEGHRSFVALQVGHTKGDAFLPDSCPSLPAQ